MPLEAPVTRARGRVCDVWVIRFRLRCTGSVRPRLPGAPAPEHRSVGHLTTRPVHGPRWLSSLAVSQMTTNLALARGSEYDLDVATDRRRSSVPALLRQL